jgi:hypothetical protein
MASQNKKMLFAYSNSPVYKDYVESTILPMIKSKAIIFNWSERKKWDKNDDFVRLFRNIHRKVRWEKSGFVPFIVIPKSMKSLQIIKLPKLPKEGIEQIETVLLETT